MVKSANVLTLALFFSINTLLAQNATLSGKVKDARSGEALISVNIVMSETLGTTSDVDGSYRITLPPGRYQVSFYYLGYKDHNETVNLRANQNLELNVRMEQSAIQSDIVVVSAGKFEQNIAELTVSMEVLKPEIIENRNTTSLDEVINQVPGVSIVDNEPQIRSGSGYSFGAGSRVMILVDDLPMLSGDAGRPSWGFLPVENVEQVEVVKGASSVLYGSAALNGVINVRTAYPRSIPKTKLTFYSGYYSDPQTAEAKYWEKTPIFNGVNFFHSRIIGNLDLVVGGTFLADQGHLGPVNRVDQNSNGETVVEPYKETYDPFDVYRANATTKGRFNLNLRRRSETVAGLNYGVNFSWQKSESYSTLLWDSIGVGLYRPFGAGDNASAATFTRQTSGYVDPFINYISSTGTRVSLKGRYYHLNNDNNNDQSNLSDVYFGELQVQQNFDALGIPDFNITAGYMTQHTDGESDLYTGGDSSGNNTATNLAGYLQLDKSLFGRVNLSAGVRFEHFDINDSSESKPVFRAGMNYQLARATFLRTSYGQGYRFPSIAEKFIRTVSGFVVVYPNPALKSETSWNAEAGIKQGFKLGNFGGYLDLAYFHQEYENYIEFTFGGWGPPSAPLFGLGFTSLNTGKSKVTGLDISLIGGGEFGGIGFQTLAGYTYSKPVTKTPDFAYAKDASGDITYLTTSSDTSGHLLKYRMQHLLRADLELTYRHFHFGTSYRYNSFMRNIDRAFVEFDDDPANPAGSLKLLPSGIAQWRREHDSGNHIFDIRIAYDVNPRQRISLVVKNLFNTEYSIRPLLIEAPRKTSLQYSVSF